MRDALLSSNGDYPVFLDVPRRAYPAGALCPALYRAGIHGAVQDRESDLAERLPSNRIKLRPKGPADE